jgi:hypothetical protein
MSDAEIYPGTELEVTEKYPLSRRLDFPAFSDVCKTSFVKGTITDFQRPEHIPPADRIAAGNPYIDLEGDPFKVESMVKVRTEEAGDSDFIPIFYHPREDFWDDPVGDVKAQDYDQEKGFFKKAWMSFRVGDEVVVMVQEGVAKAVLGFADGMPRIGEDVFSLEVSGAVNSGYWGGNNGALATNPYLISPSKAQESVADAGWSTTNPCFTGGWTLPDKDPADLDYKLLQQAEKASSAIEVQNNDKDQPFPRWQLVDYFPWDPGGFYPTGRLHFRSIENVYRCKVTVWIVVVGPIVYAIYGASEDVSARYTYYIAHSEEGGDSDGSPIWLGPYVPVIPNEYNQTLEAFWQWTWPPEGGGWGKTQWDEWYNFWYVERAERGHPTGNPPTWSYELDPRHPNNPEVYPPEGQRHKYFMVKAGIYSPELVEAIKASVSSGSPSMACGHGPEGTFAWDWGGGYSQVGYVPPIDMWPNAPADLVEQRGLTWFLNSAYQSEPGCVDLSPLDGYETPEGIDFYYRPHTKEELQAVGMWPEEQGE